MVLDLEIWKVSNMISQKLSYDDDDELRKKEDESWDEDWLHALIAPIRIHSILLKG